MLNVFVNLEEDGSYSLTTGGYVLFIALTVAVVLLGATLLSRKHKMDVKQLAFSAIAIALAVVTSNIKLIHMPMGGAVTLFSMLFITLIGYWFGFGAGLTTAIAYGCMQLVCGPYIISFPQLLVDYILAFGALSLSGIFYGKKLVLVNEVKNKSYTMYGIVPGYLLAVLGRYFFSTLSGVIFFGMYAPENFPNPVIYSMVYNGAYMGLEALITVVVIMIPPVAKALEAVKRMATEK